MSGPIKQKQEYYLNYLNNNNNNNHNGNTDANDENSDDSSFVPNEESSIEDYSQEDLDSSKDQSLAADPIIVAPRSYLRMVADGEEDSDSEDDMDSIADVVDLDDSAYTPEGNNENENWKEDTTKLERLRSAAGGSYLTMDATGNVVRSFSFLRKEDKINIRDHDDDDDDDDVHDGESISSVPRTSLPPPSDGETSARSSLLLEDEEQELELDNSFLLPPPDMSDYAPFEFSTPGANTNTNTNTQPKTKKSPSKANSKKALALATAADQSPQNKARKSFHDKQQQQQQQHHKEPPKNDVQTRSTDELLPPDHYSHLLKAYEFEHDPSIPPLPPPPKEFVLSPTDEKHMDAKHNQSPNTSYEDDIEIGTVTNTDDAAEERTKTRSRRKGAAGLFTIFSPPVASTNKIRHKHKHTDNKNKNNNTPNTDALSPIATDNHEDDDENYGDYSGRQLFDNNNCSSFDDGYEGGDSTEDCSALRGHHGKKKSMPNNGKRSAKRKLLCIIVSVSSFVLAAAIAVIAYAMIVQSRETKANASSSLVVVDIANDQDSSNNSPGTIVIEITNQTLSGNATEGDFEWVTTTPPFDAIGLRPVTHKTPTGKPTGQPTQAPTITRAPTGKPTTGQPTKGPTAIPTQAPIATMPPFHEGDFVGRLQALLQSKNYMDSTNNDDALFVFDFSSNDSLNDPANLALVYLAREVAAVMGLPDPVTTVDNNNGPELGNVVVTIGDAPPAIVIDPNFYPIILEDYDDDKLLQRFALLALQFGASSSSIRNPFAGSDDNNNDEALVAEPMKRIVFTEDALNEANSSNNNNSQQEAAFASAASIIDPSTLADPSDLRFLVDECHWEGVECTAAPDDDDASAVVTKLRWSYKTLDGSISPALGLLTSLTFLDLSNNDLTGSIPESLYKLTDLEEVFLFRNALTGTLSTLIGNLDKLERLHLSHNALSGSLPSELRSDGGSEQGIRPIRYFNAYSNQFTGSIPTDLRWRQCVHFDVGRNQLTGTLPTDLGEKFVSLRHLYLDHNAFSGTLPVSYNTVGNGRLVALALESNQLTGVVPGDRENYETLVQYTLHENNFVGLEQANCDNVLLVEFKADCQNPNVCVCYRNFFRFCERWCGTNGNNWQQPQWQQPQWQNQQQQQQRPPSQQWQQPNNSRNWSF